MIDQLGINLNHQAKYISAAGTTLVPLQLRHLHAGACCSVCPAYIDHDTSHCLHGKHMLQLRSILQSALCMQLQVGISTICACTSGVYCCRSCHASKAHCTVLSQVSSPCIITETAQPLAIAGGGTAGNAPGTQHCCTTGRMHALAAAMDASSRSTKAGDRCTPSRCSLPSRMLPSVDKQC